MYIYHDLNLREFILALESDVTIFPPVSRLKLYTNDLTPTRSTPVGDFTELTLSQVPGYAHTNPIWGGTPLRRQDGSWEDWTNQNSFVASGGPPAAPQIVYGWFLTTSNNTTVSAAGRFDVPFTFVDDGDGFSLKARLNVNQDTGTQVRVITDMVIQ